MNLGRQLNLVLVSVPFQQLKILILVKLVLIPILESVKQPADILKNIYWMPSVCS